MITRKFATQFSIKIHADTSLELDIVDNKGIIQGSTTQQDVGNFSKFAYDFINGTQDQCDVPSPVSITNSRQFTGIILAIREEESRIGALLLYGFPADIRKLAAMARLMLETSLQYEAQYASFHKYNSSRDIFHQALMYGENISKDVLESRAEKLGIWSDCLRISIFIVTEPKTDFTWILNRCSENPYFHEQDIVATSRSNRIAVFKYLDRDKQVLSSYRYTVEEYLQWWREELSGMGLQVQFNVGTIQNKLIRYRQAYQHAVWLVTSAKCQNEINWFYDYTNLYFRSMLPTETFRNVFQAYVEQLSPDVLEYFQDLIAALEECNYNFVQASKKLFIHKNTAVFRLEKLKTFLNINPTKNPRERDLLNNLHYYLQHNT